MSAVVDFLREYAWAIGLFLLLACALFLQGIRDELRTIRQLISRIAFRSPPD